MRQTKQIKFSHRFIILSLAIITLILVGLFILQSAKRVNPLVITLDKSDYRVGDNLEITFKNISSKNVCLSSNYPYLLEEPEKDGLTHQYTWKPASSSKISEKNVIGYCIAPSQTRSLSIDLTQKGKGHYRLSIPICFNCKEGELFHKSRGLYSPEFNIR